MPRTEAAYQQIRAERKKQILQAAASVFARKGLAQATITDIAAAAGISHGLLYSHFASKEDLFAAVLEQSLAEAQHVAQLALEQPGTPWERIRWLTAHLFPGGPLGRRPDFFFVVLHALTHEGMPEHVRKLAAQPGDIIYTVLRQLVVAGQQAGQVVSGDPDHLVNVYLSCVQGLVLRSVFYRKPRSTFPSMEALLRILQAEH
jgi:AcrR family transcriptional regulator